MLKGKKILAAFLSLTLTMSMFVGMSTIAKAGSVNLALNKTASASSVYPGSGNIASNAFDGDSTVSRWASNWDNNEWLEVDLGKKYSITGAKLVWQYASGENYTIQVSKDNINWTTACTVTGGTNSETMDTTASPYPSDASAFTATVGRYVRMNATLPTTIWGYSIYEFEVYGDDTTNQVIDPTITPSTGTFKNAQPIAINDNGSGAQIYYTTDGSFPTDTNGTSYTGSGFTVSNTTTINAVAYKSGMNESNVVSSTITILTPPTGLSATSSMSNAATLNWTALNGASSYNVYRSTSSGGPYTQINTKPVTTNSYADLGVSGSSDYYYVVTALNGIETGNSNEVHVRTPAASTPDFGPNVYIFDPSMDASGAIQSVCTSVFNNQETSEMGTGRYALLFKQGSYPNTNIRVGFYTQVAGLGTTPGAVDINSVGADAGWNSGNATDNFWRSLENLTVDSNTKWAVSQASPIRRVHIKGNLQLDDGGYASGGFISDTVVDGEVDSDSQQQWISRNSTWSSWSNGVWNQVFVGDNNDPAGSWPTSPYTEVAQTPAVKEAPYLTLDSNNNYSVYVPALKYNSTGVDWSSGQEEGTSLPISDFYIAHPDTDTAETINQALSDGKDLIFTPGIYNLDEALQINNASTVILGLGFATLVPTNGTAAIKTADVDGVSISGLIIDAGAEDSPVLLQLGPEGSSTANHSNPSTLSDVYFRVGGATVGTADTSLEINSNNVIGDNLWVWRADHGAGSSPIWTGNPAKNGLIVNGNDVTMYGLAVEHYQQYQTIWNGNGGKVYFYQSELPYDVPSQASWTHDGINGYASFKVADSVTSFEAWGLGIYSYFDQNVDIHENSAIEAPLSSSVIFHDVCTVFLTGSGQITHIINNTGNAVYDNGANMRYTLTSTIPVITLTGSPTMYVVKGTTFNDPGATAVDADQYSSSNISTSIVPTYTNNVNSSTTFDSSVAGTYTVHYNVTDSNSLKAAEVTRTVIIVNHDDLTAAIATDTTEANAAVVGTATGDYAQIDITTYTDAIAAAQAVVDNTSAIQSDIDAAVSTLAAAKTTFESSAVQAATVDKSALIEAIATDTTEANVAVVGTATGDYAQTDITTYTDAIGAAQAVVNNTSAIQSDVVAAVSNLAAAKTTFESSAVQAATVDKSALIEAIATDTTEANAAVVGTANGDVPQSALDNLKTAIDTATAVNTSATATQSAVDNQVTALNQARTAFNNAVIVKHVSSGGGTVTTPTPTPTNVTGTTNNDGSTSANIPSSDTNTSTVSNVVVNLGSVTVTAPASVLSSALGSDTTNSLSLSQATTATPTQTAVNAAAASKGITPVSTLDIDLTNVSSSGALVPVHQLSGNITVTIALTDAQIAQIADVSKVRLYYFDPDTNTLTDMNATFDLTAKTVTFTTNHFSTYVIANTTSTSTTTTPANNIGVTYNAQVQHIGWQSFVSDGAQAGTTGKALRLEGVKINLTGNVPQGAKITYQAQVQKLGWMSAVSNGALAGTVGKALRLEALKITLSGMSGYEVEYRAQVQGAGWQKWQVSKNGTSISSAAIAGTTGKGLRLEAIEIKIVKIA